MYINKKIILFIAILMLLIPSIALGESTLDSMDEKIDEQNDSLYESIMDSNRERQNALEGIFDESDRKNAESGEINLSKISSGIQRASILFAVKARKYIVPITAIIMLFNIFMLSVTGAKNIKSRKKYIYGSVFFYVFFLIILNFPLYLLWRNTIDAESLINFEAFHLFVKNTTNFLREHSFVLAVIVFTFGVINYISSEQNLPKQLASVFMVKMSFVLFIFLNIIPLLLKIAV